MKRLKRLCKPISPFLRQSDTKIVSGVISILLVFISTGLYAKNGDKEWIEKKKNVTFSYTVSPSDKISLNNQFGDIKVTFWDKNEVKVEVLILANATSEERASNYISTVDIVGKKEDGVVSIRTLIDREECDYNNNARVWKGNGEKNSLKVDYQVFMPKSNQLRVKNSFGNTYLPSISSVVSIDQNYGTLQADEIRNVLSDVDVSFGKATINSMQGGKLKVSYSDLMLNKADDIYLTNSFGKLDVKEAGKIDAKISYSKGSIGLLRESSIFKLEFSEGFKLGNLGKNVKELDIKANYSPVNLTLENGTVYDFDVKSHYGAFDYPDDRGVSFTRNSESDTKKEHHYSFNPTKYYTGKIGKGSSICKITINGNFSTVKFK